MEHYLYKDLYQLEDAHWWHRAKRLYAMTILRSAINKFPLRILDVGCGTGKNVEVFRAFGTTEGIDIAPEAIAYCRKRGINAVRIGDAVNTKYPNHSFDAVLLFDILEHADDHAVLKEMHRIVKPGGLILMTVPAYTWLWSRWDDVLHHKRRYTAKSLRHVLVQHYFSVVKISFLFSFLVFPALCIRFVKKLLYKNKFYPSDFVLSAPIINTLLFFLCQGELAILKYGSIPFGTSIIAIAKKENEE